MGKLYHEQLVSRSSTVRNENEWCTNLILPAVRIWVADIKAVSSLREIMKGSQESIYVDLQNEWNTEHTPHEVGVMFLCVLSMVKE
jgi:hypothetical protein